jgi:hypothetical protein
MSLYTKLVTDSSWLIYPFEATVDGTNGIASTYYGTQTKTTTGTPTRTSSSPTGQSYYWTFGSGTQLDIYDASNNTSGGTAYHVLMEAVVKPTTAGSQTYFVLDRRSNSTNYMNIGITPSGYAYASGRSGNANTALTATGSTNLVNGTWHHLAAIYRTDGYLYLYVDGTQVATSNTGGVQVAGFDFLTNRAHTYINQGGDLAFDLDIAAVSTDLSGTDVTATMVLDHFNTWASSINTVSPMTATALMPAIIMALDKNIAADPATASADMGNTIWNLTDLPNSLDTYLATLNLEQWIKISKNGLRDVSNYGSGGNSNYFQQAVDIKYNWAGPNGSSAARIGEYSVFQTSNETSNPFFDSEINDDNFALGFWVRYDKDNVGNTAILLSDGIAGNSLGADGQLNIFYAGGNLIFEIGTSVDVYDYVSARTLYDDKWHFIAVRYDGTNFKAYLDGTQIVSETISGTRSDIGLFQWVIRQNDYGYVSLSNIIIGSYSNISPTVISNIWNAGNVNDQGYAFMPNPVVKFNNAFNDKVESYEPQIDFRFDDTGQMGNYGTGSQASSASAEVNDGTHLTTSITSKNRKQYNFTHSDTEVFGGYGFANGTFSTGKTLNMVGTMTDPSAQDTPVNIYYIENGVKLTNNSAVLGIVLGADPGGPFVIMTNNSTQTVFLDSSPSYFGSPHMYSVVFKQSNQTCYFYIDSVLVDSAVIPDIVLNDSAVLSIGNGENTWFGIPTEACNKYIDELQLYSAPLTQQQLFELYQAQTIDQDWQATTEMVSPLIYAGTGALIAQGEPMTSYGVLSHPYYAGNDLSLPLSFEATALMAHPNFEGIQNIDLAAAPLIATDAELHEPQLFIGAQKGAASMDATSQFPAPSVLIPGFWNANPFIANDATLVDPTISSTLGALIYTTSMDARAIAVLPPAYKTNFDDKWYSYLYQQHSFKHGETGYTANVSSATAFLNLFDGVTSNISPLTATASKRIANSLPYSIIKDLAADTTEGTDYASNIDQFLTENITPLLEIGTYDPYDRKAIRFRNTEFQIPEDIYKSDSGNGFSLEFSIKTTKSNQIIASGEWRSFQFTQRNISGFGLYNGSLYGMNSFPVIGTAYQPAFPTTKIGTSYEDQIIFGNKKIDDGIWHHVILQFKDDRFQIWVDGELDVQKFTTQRIIRPFRMGHNSSVVDHQSDFETSGWSYDAAHFVEFAKIQQHFFKYSNFVPVNADVSYVNAEMIDPVVTGNRGRALMLYWLPVNTELMQTSDTGKYGYFDEDTFARELLTIDYVNQPPQEYYGWDIFPVDINGYYVSDLVKTEAYGGEKNIILQDLGGFNPPPGGFAKFKANRRGYFRDARTDERRYLDVLNDIDLSKFDAIFFKNFPDQSQEIDLFAKNEEVSSYFHTVEKELYEQFIRSLRDAVDTGISLFVTNHQLAVDLGIIDRVEEVPDLDDLTGSLSDPYAPTQIPGSNAYSTQNSAYWVDSYKNNRLRVVNTLPGLTDDPGFIWKDTAYYVASDANSFGETNRPFQSYEYKPLGLQVGDEIVISDFYFDSGAIKYLAVPFENIKSGRAITAFANYYRKGVELVANPYANYATSIALEPGDILNGKQVGGKIFVNFTERLNPATFSFNSRRHNGASDVGAADLITDYFINLAYNENQITDVVRDQLLTSANNLDRKLAAGKITQQQYDDLVYWTSNGNYILTDATIINDPTGTGVQKDGLGDGQRTSVVVKTKKSGAYGTTRVTTDSQWFSFTYGWTYPKVQLKVPSMMTRGFLWLSERLDRTGLYVGHEAQTAIASMPMPKFVAQRDAAVNAPSLVASVDMANPFGYAHESSNIVSLPMTVYGIMNDYVTNNVAVPMTATAKLAINISTATAEVDEIIVYINHVDPILYVREDIIK